MNVVIILRAGAAGAVITMSAAQSATACEMPVPLRLEVTKSAQVVVVGRIANYTIVPGVQAQSERRKLLETSLNIPRHLRKALTDQIPFLGEFARFDIVVDEVLKGKAPRRLTVGWNAPNSREPATMPSGPYVIALQGLKPGAPTDGRPNTLMVVNPPCSSAFIIDEGSPNAAAIRRILLGKKPLPAITQAAQDNSSSLIAADYELHLSAKALGELYPARALEDEVEGSATVECVAVKDGSLRCKLLSETPTRYGFGAVTVRLFESYAKLTPRSFRDGDRVKITKTWQLP